MTQLQARPIEFLPTVSEILTQVGADGMLASHSGEPTPLAAAREAERQWQAGLSALTSLLHQVVGDRPPTRGGGMILCGPQAIWSQTVQNEHFVTRIFSSGRLMARLPGQISPDSPTPIELALPESATIPLMGGDPLTGDRFCVVLTSEFSLAMVRGLDAHGMPAFQFSFDPQAIATIWASLRSRVVLTQAAQLESLDALVCQFTPIAPHYKTVLRFSQLLLQSLPEGVQTDVMRPLPGQTARPSRRQNASRSPLPGLGDRTQDASRSGSRSGMCDAEEATPPDVELLQAIAHEVRTPLSTIRTFTRLLLKRRDLDPDAVKWLETIDRECSEQIDRFGLIFRAVELETSPVKRSPMHLTRTSLEQAIGHCIPRWQKQACRRGLKLEVSLPQTMPRVVSDPTMLDQVLSGAIDNFTSSLPAGSQVTVQVILAGHQLKLQLKSEPPNPEISGHSSPLKSIGQLLMFQPETGNLSLNLSVTKNLFQALGGKLVVRNRPHQGEELTIFFPLE